MSLNMNKSYNGDHIAPLTSEQINTEFHRQYQREIQERKDEDAKGEFHIPYLKHFAVNLNQKVKRECEQNGAPIQYAVGRRDKILNIMEILLHKHKNAPILIGEAGVGKTDIVEGFADALNRGNVPDMLKGCQVYTLDLALMNDSINPPHKAGYFNSNLKHVLNECKRYKNKIILFIDEIHMIVGASRKTSSAGMDSSQILKQPLGRGEFKMIGATTYDEYYDFIKPDPALKRRMKPIQIPEPNKKTVYKILKGNVQGFSNHYNGITINDQALHRVVNLSARYMPDLFMPDKAFDIMDDAFSEAVLLNQSQVDDDDVDLSIYHSTGIPMSSIELALQPQVAHLGELLQRRVKGQDQAINRVVDAIDLFFAGLNDPTKPKASFLFLGTTGVGKTELAKSIAQSLFGSEHAMIRLDMASFDTQDATAKLLGIHGKRGILTEAVRRKPYSVLLLDEIEKSAPPVWDLLLSILDDGEIQDSRGRTVDFSNLIIILTSNLASDAIKNRLAYENTDTKSPEERKYRQYLFNKEVQSALKLTFKPELVNRLSNIVVFNVLQKPQIIKISKKYMDDLLKRLRYKGYDLMFDFDTIDYLTDLGTDVNNGARPLQRALAHELADKIGRYIVSMNSTPEMKQRYKNFRTFTVTVKGKRPSKHDLWGNRKFIIKVRDTPVTPKEVQQRASIFTDSSIAKMMALHSGHPNIAGQIKRRIEHNSLRQSPLDVQP